MKLSPTEALKLINVSADTLYKDMKRGKLSFEKKGSRKRLIDVAELERVYGPLKAEADFATSENVSSDIRADKRRESGESSATGSEIALLRQQVETLAQERRREREQMQDQIQHLHETLKAAQDHQTRLTALLTDQRQETSRKEALEQAQLIRELKLGHVRLRQELNAMRDQRGLFARWLGIGASKKAPPARPAASKESGS